MRTTLHPNEIVTRIVSVKYDKNIVQPHTNYRFYYNLQLCKYKSDLIMILILYHLPFTVDLRRREDLFSHDRLFSHGAHSRYTALYTVVVLWFSVRREHLPALSVYSNVLLFRQFQNQTSYKSLSHPHY